jgi:hypothetical protein
MTAPPVLRYTLPVPSSRARTVTTTRSMAQSITAPYTTLSVPELVNPARDGDAASAWERRLWYTFRGVPGVAG